jgi:hypothetical protein
MRNIREGYIIDDGQRVEFVTDDELSRVRGGSFFSRLKAAARWVKDHVVIGLHKIGIKGKF